MDTPTDYEATYAKQQALKKLYEQPALFGKTCFPTAFRKTTPRFHLDIYAALKDPTKKRVLVAAPRGTAKSTVSTLVYPLWRIAFKRSDEELFIVIVSESSTQSINFLNRIKYHLNHSERFKELFGDLSQNTARKWREDDVVLANGTRIVAIGTGQRIRGFIEGDTRPNLIIVDDFESELNAKTREARARNRKWLTEAVIPSLADDGEIVVIGTVISEDCFLYYAKDSSAWTTLWYQIVDDEGNLLWAERFPHRRIKQIREEYASVGNLRGFYQEYMNIAQAPDEQPFKPHYIKYHGYALDRIHGQSCLVKRFGDATEDIVIPVDLYSGVDVASTLSATADFFVIATVALDSLGNKYLVDLYRKRLDPAEQPRKLINTFKTYRPKKMKVETVAYQEALRAHTKKLMQEEGLYIPGLESGVKPRNAKSERLISLVPMLARGEFYFRHQDTVAVDEFLSYPAGKHDDIMDAIWTALDSAKPCTVDAAEDLEPVEKEVVTKEVDWRIL